MTFKTESCNRLVALKGRDMNDFLNTYSLHLTVQNATPCQARSQNFINIYL